jgi:hypothetical protein
MKKSIEIDSNPILKERRWIIVFAFTVMMITTLPYIIGYQVQNSEWSFTGFLFGVTDGNSYIAKMLRGANGEWLFRTPFSAQSQKGTFIFFHYLLLGKITSAPGQHEQLVVLYHLIRFVGGVLSILAGYDFLALFLKEPFSRRLGVIIATIGGGAGWLLVMLGKSNWLGSLPLDFYSPETFGFLGLYGIAHLPWARAFLLWGLRSYLIKGTPHIPAPRPISRIAELPPGILWLLTGLSQPITGMVVGAVAGFHLFGLFVWQSWQKRSGRTADWAIVTKYFFTAMKAGSVALPLVLYSALVFSLDPFLKIWVEQSRIPAPHLFHYLAAFGVVIPFVLVGIPRLMKNQPEWGALPVTWIILTPVLLILPFSLQRRLVEGLWIVLVLVALIPLENLVSKTWRWAYVFLIFTLPTTLFLLAGGVGVALQPAAPVYRPAEEIAAFKFLAQTATSDEVVLSSFHTGNALPAWAPVFVVIGHGPETVNIKTIEPRVQDFYRTATTDQDRLNLLAEFGVDYVFWGPYEREFGSWHPEAAQFLESIFSQGEYSIWRVDE